MCEICGNTFEVRKKVTQRFCSVECQCIWQTKQIGVNHPKYARIQVVCDNCGKEVEVIPANLKRFQNHFCSDVCRKEWYSSVWSKTPEWREMSRIRAARQVQCGTSTDTLPQRCVNQMLKDVGVQYENEYNVTYYSVDNYLTEYNLMIEVMGDFWHCNPVVYDSAICEVQRKRIPKDIAKHTYILNKYGIEVLYLWEKDILERPQVCMKLIMKYISGFGRLANYHSYNWEIKAGQLVLNDVLIPAYSDRHFNRKNVG